MSCLLHGLLIPFLSFVCGGLRVGLSKHRRVVLLAKLLCIWGLAFVPGDVVNDSVLFRCCHS